MISVSILSELENRIGTKIRNYSYVSGGCINECFKLETPGSNYFIKINSATKFPQLFESEIKGLQLLSAADVKTPGVIDYFILNDFQVLILEWINVGVKNKTFYQNLGNALANVHRMTGKNYGLERDNYIGSIPQKNDQKSTWTDFFCQNRLEPLVQHTFSENLLPLELIGKFHNLYLRIDGIFDQEPPCLIHGDLWSENVIADHESNPVFIDPSIYYGHRSMDLAMTTLFGGFDQAFYDAYKSQYSLPDNYREQWKAANLYPLLVHLLLFGKSYLPQIEKSVNEFI